MGFSPVGDDIGAMKAAAQEWLMVINAELASLNELRPQVVALADAALAEKEKWELRAGLERVLVQDFTSARTSIGGAIDRTEKVALLTNVDSWTGDVSELFRAGRAFISGWLDAVGSPLASLPGDGTNYGSAVNTLVARLDALVNRAWAATNEIDARITKRESDRALVEDFIQDPTGYGSYVDEAISVVEPASYAALLVSGMVLGGAGLAGFGIGTVATGTAGATVGSGAVIGGVATTVGGVNVVAAAGAGLGALSFGTVMKQGDTFSVGQYGGREMSVSSYASAQDVGDRLDLRIEVEGTMTSLTLPTNRAGAVCSAELEGVAHAFGALESPMTALAASFRRLSEIPPGEPVVFTENGEIATPEAPPAAVVAEPHFTG